jgi:prepilin-type N-terminal cleavage/methylation domain-containing protein
MLAPDMLRATGRSSLPTVQASEKNNIIPKNMTKQSRNRSGGFTLIEIMIVVAIIALLAAIAVPSALRARKRSQASSTLQTLRILDAACDQWAIEYGKATNAAPTVGNLELYVKKSSQLYNQLVAGSPLDALGNAIALPVVDTPPKVPTATYGSLSDVADSTFWGAYYNSGS